jgi:hypothetical protein
MNARLFRYFSAGAMLALSLGAAAPVRAAPQAPAVTTIVVKPSAMNGWVFYDDTNDLVNNSLGTFVYGPATPITGKGSAQITISPNTPAQRTNLATYQFAGTKLADITEMKFELYNPSGKDVTTGYLNFNVDWDGSDTWQRRLVFSSFPVVQNTWRNIDALGASMWWLSGGNWPAGLGGGPGSTPQAWSTIAAYNPGIARLRLNDGHLGLRVGSGGVGDNYTENYSSFTFGVLGTTTIFDFEPEQQVVVVRPGAMGNWYFFNDTTNAVDPTLGSFVTGPGTPYYGTGSAQISVSGPTDRRTLANSQFGGTMLSDLTALKYRTYNPSAGNGYGPNAAGYLYFNIDFTGSNTWQSSLIFLPSDNGGVTTDTWKEFDTFNGGNALWRYSGATWPAPLSGPGLSTTYTWNQIKTAYPPARILALYGGMLSIRVGEPYPGGYTENIDSVTVGTVAAGVTVFDFEPAGLSMTPATKLMGVGQSFTQDLVLNGANNLYGYQYMVTYDASKLSAVGSFVNTLFDTTVDASVPPAWNAVCAAGVCKFAASKTLPASPVNGSGAIGRIVFTALAPGVVPVSYSGATLSDPDANPITVGTQGSVVTIYGAATINGVVKLQGRATPIQDGVVYLTDMSGTFGPKAGTFNGATGAYAIAVPAVAGGTTWRITVDHSLYLSNQTGPGTDLVVMPGVNQTLATQTLRAGDANNSEVVDIADLSCVGGAFGGAPTTCGLTGSSDINWSGGVDIFDLVLVGGNYNKASPQLWQ